MKTLRILLVLALCGGANMSQAMWLRAGRAIASRLATRCAQPMQAVKAGMASASKPMASFRSGLSNSFKNRRAMAGLAFFGSGGAAAYGYKHTTSQESAFSKNGTITIKDIAGSINVKGWEHDRLEIKTSKEACTQEDLDQTKISIKTTQDNADLQTNIGSKSFDNYPTIISYDNQTYINGKPAIRVRYDVRAPHYAQLVLRTVAGNIALEGILGSVDAQTISGKIETTRCQNIKASSTSGNVYLEQSYGTADASSTSGNVMITNNQKALDVASQFGLEGQTKGFTLEHATATSTTGNATIIGAVKGKASSTTGKVSFNGQTGSSICRE